MLEDLEVGECRGGLPHEDRAELEGARGEHEERAVPRDVVAAAGLGPARGASAMALYLVVGVAGVPVDQPEPLDLAAERLQRRGRGAAQLQQARLRGQPPVPVADPGDLRAAEAGAGPGVEGAPETCRVLVDPQRRRVAAHARASSMAPQTRSGVMGRERMRTPVAAAMALLLWWLLAQRRRRLGGVRVDSEDGAAARLENRRRFFRRERSLVTEHVAPLGEPFAGHGRNHLVDDQRHIRVALRPVLGRHLMGTEKGRRDVDGVLRIQDADRPQLLELRLGLATPAAFSLHAKSRRDSQALVDQFLALEPDVLMGGGADYFLPEGVPRGKRKDGKDVIAAFRTKGYQVVRNTAELNAATGPKLLGLFADEDMDFELDRDPAREPSTAEMAAAALKAPQE